MGHAGGMDPERYCIERAAPPGSSLHYALRGLAPRARRALLAVHALRREVEAVPLECRDPGVALAKLGWWREELSTLAGGEPRHPVTRALARAARDFPLPREPLGGMVETVADLVRGGPPGDTAALERHCARTGGAAGLVGAQILGWREPATLDAALACGTAMALVEHLQDVGAEARAGRALLPRALMERHGIRAVDLARTPAPEGVRAALAELGALAEGAWRGALARLPERDRPAQRPHWVLGALHLALLAEMARDGWRLSERRVALTPVRKLWIAWRATRRLRRAARAARS